MSKHYLKKLIIFYVLDLLPGLRLDPARPVQVQPSPESFPYHTCPSRPRSPVWLYMARREHRLAEPRLRQPALCFLVLQALRGHTVVGWCQPELLQATASMADAAVRELEAEASKGTLIDKLQGWWWLLYSDAFSSRKLGHGLPTGHRSMRHSS